MIGAGVYLGASFDTFSRLRLKKNQTLMIIQDLLFWILNGLFIFIWLKEVNDGEMRIHVLLSLACGYAMYKALFEATYRKLLEKMISMIIAIYRFFIRLMNQLIIQPIIWLYKMLIALLLFLAGLIVALGRYLYRLLLFFYKPLEKLSLYLWRQTLGKLLKGKPKESNPDSMETENVKNSKKKRGLFSWVAKWYKKK